MNDYTTVADAEAGVRDTGAHLNAIRTWQMRIEKATRSLRTAEVTAATEHARAVDALVALLSAAPLPGHLQDVLQTTNLAYLRLENDVARLVGGIEWLEGS